MYFRFFSVNLSWIVSSSLF